jgi:hypothetical protein
LPLRECPKWNEEWAFEWMEKWTKQNPNRQTPLHGPPPKLAMGLTKEWGIISLGPFTLAPGNSSGQKVGLKGEQRKEGKWKGRKGREGKMNIPQGNLQ